MGMARNMNSCHLPGCSSEIPTKKLGRQTRMAATTVSYQSPPTQQQDERIYSMEASLIDKALEIIRATHDGNDLSPPHLKLVELAVNGFLTEQGKLAFEELYRNATKPGGYTIPWF